MQASKDVQRSAFATTHAPSPFAPPTSHLGPGLRVKGEITGNEDLKLDGQVEGSVSVGGFRLTVAQSAQVKADLVAREAIISGEVIGDIRAADRVEILRTASITGNVTTGKIVIEEGAYFNGDVEVGGQAGQIGADLDSLLRDANKPKDF
jgi:cytoskeletal protein CcmA (bactofilin family)